MQRIISVKTETPFGTEYKGILPEMWDMMPLELQLNTVMDNDVRYINELPKAQEEIVGIHERGELVTIDQGE